MREVKPYYKKSHRCYYVNLNGKPTRLDPNRDIAWKLYRKLASAADDEPATNEELASPTVKVQTLLIEFLAWVETHREAGTLEHYQKYLAGKGSFADFIGAKFRVIDLKPFHV